jgi:hypothetical protein
MGQKSEPSLTSGGIGITQEVTNIGGMSVSAGANIDITPLDFGISVGPSEGTVSLATGAEVPGGLLGISGGITIDTNTGEIIGGSIGGEVGGLGINISNSKKGGLGIEFTVQIPGTPIELSLGLGFPPKKELTPTPTPSIPPPGPFSAPDFPIGGNRNCLMVIAITNTIWGPSYFTYASSKGTYKDGNIYGSTEAYGVIDNVPYTLPTEIHDGDRMFSYIGDYLTIGYLRGFFYAAGIESRVYKAIRDEGWFNREDGPYVYRKMADIIYSNCSMGADPPDSSNSPSPSPSPSPFPNPPPRKQNKMDDCCKENLRFLRAIYNGLGIAKFPGRLPSTIIQEVSKEGEEPAEPSQVPIKDFVDLLNWQFERDDERWGQWEIQIDIKDSDITKEGDQKKSIKFPNLAESVAELEGQILSIMTNVDALVALQVKNLAESGMARQEAIKGYLASKAIIKYMAFKSSETDVPVPMTFTAGAETLSELLKESEGHIKGTDYTEKETFRDVCVDLLQAAAIIRAVHWQRIDTKTDTKSQLLNILKGSVDLATSIAKPAKSKGDGQEQAFNPEKDFEDFIDAVEDGFRNTTGITDLQNPYGKSPDRRPRIRQIGDNIDQAGKGN